MTDGRPRVPLIGLNWLGIVALSYLVGSFPTAYLVVRLQLHQDIRSLGDYNAGAANVARIAGRRMGIGVGVVDIAKGAVVVLAAQNLSDSAAAPLVAGVAVVAGHNWPVFLMGRGGRGAAPAAGVLMALVPYAALPLALPGLLVLYLTRSTTKTLAFYYILTICLAAWPAQYPMPVVAYCVALPILIGLSHYVSARFKPLAGAEGRNEPASP